MRKDRDFLKLAILVFSGVLAGVLITMGVQTLSLPGQHVNSHETTAAQPPPPAADPNRTTAAASSNQPDKFSSPSPVSDALARLNNGKTAVPDGQGVIVPPGMQYSQSTSGYPVYTGGRAVDSLPVQQIPAQQISAPNLVVVGEPVQVLPPQPVGRNGLLSNPCVDPASAHRIAGGRQAY